MTLSKNATSEGFSQRKQIPCSTRGGIFKSQASGRRQKTIPSSSAGRGSFKSLLIAVSCWLQKRNHQALSGEAGWNRKQWLAAEEKPHALWVEDDSNRKHKMAAKENHEALFGEVASNDSSAWGNSARKYWGREYSLNRGCSKDSRRGRPRGLKKGNTCT